MNHPGMHSSSSSAKSSPQYDVIVVGGGHAGCEAALSCARMGARTLMLTMRLDTVAAMPCNPAIGGVAKGQVVREIDALGGEMGKAADATVLQFRMLNRSKGEAVWSPRAQCDRRLYHEYMRKTLERQDNLSLKAGEVCGFLISRDHAAGVVLSDGTTIGCRCVIVTTGTFLNGTIHIGLRNFPGGRIGEQPSVGLSETLRTLGFHVLRFKTGTPARVHKDSIDYSKMEIQEGDAHPVPFSHFTDRSHWPYRTQLPCWITYTTKSTHEAILENLDRSPLYSGVITGIGPRYCPSIEDKVVRFKDKDRHQVFVEPEGFTADEMYLNGVSTSLPEDVQERIVRSIPGLENAKILRYGYGIEYDFCPPTQLTPWLETKLVKGLFFAGQINGTTGYEEAAAQGLMAGINAVLVGLRQDEPFVLRRDEAYIGVLVDDLVTKGVMDPYRLFTSRAEFRLLLRTHNADLRIMDYGFRYGLINECFLLHYEKYRRAVESVAVSLEKMHIPESQRTIADEIRSGDSIEEVLEKLSREQRGQLSADASLDPRSPWSADTALYEACIQVKYAGYVERALQYAARLRELDHVRIPADFDYTAVPGLLGESRVKLSVVRPTTLGQASRVSGVTPADIGILMVFLKRRATSGGELR